MKRAEVGEQKRREQERRERRVMKAGQTEAQGDMKRGEEREEEEIMEKGLRMCRGHTDGWWEEMKRDSVGDEGEPEEGVKRWMEDVMKKEREWKEKERERNG